MLWVVIIVQLVSAEIHRQGTQELLYFKLYFISYKNKTINK